MIRRPPRSTLFPYTTPSDLIDSPLRQPDGKVAPYQPAGGATYGDTEIGRGLDRKSTRLNSSHQIISYAVFCLKKKTSLLVEHEDTFHHRTLTTNTQVGQVSR